MTKIKITCKGQKYYPINKLKDFQGALKTLDKNEAEKLKRSILKHGFSFPVFVWGDFMLDGHQRIFVVGEMIKDGYEIDKIPVVEIDASSESEAAEKLLLLNSRYAKITDDGLLEYLSKFDLDLSKLNENLISLPEVDIERLIDHNYERQESIVDESFEEQYQILIECSGESQQVELLNRFEEEGITCRALIS